MEGGGWWVVSGSEKGVEIKIKHFCRQYEYQ